jgi:hypothetical protein
MLGTTFKTVSYLRHTKNLASASLSSVHTEYTDIAQHRLLFGLSLLYTDRVPFELLDGAALLYEGKAAVDWGIS